MFGKFTKIMMCISAFCCLICTGLCVYVALVEPIWYAVAALFLLATVWFGINAYNLFKDKTP